MREPIAIVGGGLGGLMLARVLHLRGVPAVLYEADASHIARAQGGMLDIHVGSGQRALREADLLDSFRTLVLADRQAMRILDRDGTVLLDRADDGTGGRPEVMRGDLRRMLLDSLPPDTVRWDHKVSAIRPLGAGRHELVFANGETASTRLLVGADGAWSRVRPLLSDAVPAYAGLSYVETYLFDADTRHPASARAVGTGSMGAPATGKAIMAHREVGDTLHTYIMLSRPLDWFGSIDFEDPHAAALRIAHEFEGWAPALAALVTDSDVAPMHRPLYALPPHHRWDRVAGVTLIGDAAHLATPNGEGANLAMVDGADLGKAIAEHPEDVEAALAAFEQAMFTRSAASALEGMALYDMLLGDDPAHHLVKMFDDA